MKKIYSFLALFLFLCVANAQSPVLIEKFTSVSCGWCATGAEVLEDVSDDYPNAVLLAHHVSSTLDPMTMTESLELFNYYGWGTPTATFNRNHSAVGRTSWDGATASAGLGSLPVDVTTVVTFDTSNRKLDVTITAKFLQDLQGTYRFNCFIVEDSVIGGQKYDQKDYTNQWGFIPGFVHMNVARWYFGGAFGTPNSIPDNPEKDSVYSISYSTTLADSIKPWHARAIGVVSGYGSVMDDRKVQGIHQTTLGGTTSKETEKTEVFAVFPNPAKDQMNIHTNLRGNWQLLDLSGKLLKSGYTEKSQSTVLLSDFSPGFYLMRFHAENGRHSSKKILVTE